MKKCRKEDETCKKRKYLFLGFFLVAAFLGLMAGGTVGLVSGAGFASGITLVQTEIIGLCIAGILTFLGALIYE
ncbi:hypothetical protein [Winogradskyella aurantiaca]|uniref:hypothetical protein n=1 Tax=Winogradskyella aurantiaca TaxID=2219558 RepID=UPI000E1D797B|nr:hypothetical protein [Winogradskyella aurantiaca]